MYVRLIIRRATPFSRKTPRCSTKRAPRSLAPPQTSSPVTFLSLNKPQQRIRRTAKAKVIKGFENGMQFTAEFLDEFKLGFLRWWSKSDNVRMSRILYRSWVKFARFNNILTETRWKIVSVTMSIPSNMHVIFDLRTEVWTEEYKDKGIWCRDI